MDYKVGDIVEFKNDDGAMKYGLITDIYMDFVHIVGCDDVFVLYTFPISHISRRCNRYHVGDQVYCTITHGVVEVIDIGRTYFSDVCWYKVQSIHSKAIYSQVEEEDLNKYLVASYIMPNEVDIQETDYTKYKVGDIVEFRNDDDALEYGLIKDIGEIYDPIRDNCKGYVFQIEHGFREVLYLSMDNIYRRCNKYCVGQRVWYADLALECIITDIYLADYDKASGHVRIRYCVRDIMSSSNDVYFVWENQITIRPMNYGLTRNDIDKVIFNDPATIIIWKDGTKTVVKTAPGETYSKWAGMALCISKKLYGDRFHRIFKEYCGEEKEKDEEKDEGSLWKEMYQSLVDACKNIGGENNGEV